MLTNEKSRDHIDIMITGILDEPITIRELVGPGVAELFVPKLSEFFDRKLSFDSLLMKGSIAKKMGSSNIKKYEPGMVHSSQRINGVTSSPAEGSRWRRGEKNKQAGRSG